MFDLFQSPVRYLLSRNAKTLPDALIGSISLKQSRQYCTQVPLPFAIEHVAKQERLNRRKLLEISAKRLGLGFACNLRPPGRQLLLKAGFSARPLEERFILPQESAIASAGYALVVADPSTIQIPEFERDGVQVLLGLGTEIASAWRNFKAIHTNHSSTQSPEPELPSDEIVNVLQTIVRDSSRLGAREVFLGHPHDGVYEFVGEKGLFSGEVHERVFNDLIQYFRHARELLVTPSDESDLSFRAALTRNFEKLIVCLTWESVIDHSPWSGRLCSEPGGSSSAARLGSESSHERALASVR